MAEFRTVKLLKYVTEMDYFGLACELIFAAFVAYYTVEEILEIRKHKFVYFTYVWNLLDIAVLVVSCALRYLLHPRRGAQCMNLKGNSAAPM